MLCSGLDWPSAGNRARPGSAARRSGERVADALETIVTERRPPGVVATSDVFLMAETTYVYDFELGNEDITPNIPELHELWNWEGDPEVLPYKWLEAL